MKYLSVIFKAVCPICCIAALVIIEMKALSLGIDGVLLGGVCAIIGGLGGFEVKAIKELANSKKEVKP